MTITLLILGVVVCLFICGCISYIGSLLFKLRSLQSLAGEIWMAAAAMFTIYLVLWICGLPVL